MRMTILCGLTLVLLAGCGEDDDDGATRASLEGPLVYERGGGLAGRRDRLVLQPSGTAKLTVRNETREVELKPAELDRIAAEVERIDLASLPEDSTTKPPVADAFGYRIQYGASEITTDDPGMPDELRGLVGRLTGIVERYEP